MTTRSFDAASRLSWLVTPLLAAFLAACSGSTPFVGPPDGGDADVDASKPHVTHDGAAADAPHATTDGASHPTKDSGSPPDAAHPFDVVVPPLDASHPSDAHLTFPDASGPVAACESCLDSTCGADAQKCEADPSCTAAINCAISTGCLAPGDAGGVEACVDACIKGEGLTPHEQAAVVQEIAALATCATPCASSCAFKDGGSS